MPKTGVFLENNNRERTPPPADHQEDVYMQIDDNSLDKIEVLLTQSMKGIHLLYDNDTIAKILQIPTEELDFFNFENMDKIQELFSDLITKESFEEKQRYINNLNPDNYEILLRTYFHIVESTLLTATNYKH